jgi:hypothetical protein
MSDLLTTGGIAGGALLVAETVDEAVEFDPATETTCPKFSTLSTKKRRSGR